VEYAARLLGETDDSGGDEALNRLPRRTVDDLCRDAADTRAQPRLLGRQRLRLQVENHEQIRRSRPVSR